MRSRLAALANRLALNAGVQSTIVFRVWSMLSGLVTLGLVLTKFSAEIQGYYYTFASLGLMQEFLQLGFSGVLVQFICHEWARLEADPTGRVVGDENSHRRLASLVKLGVWWYAVLALIVFVCASLGGLAFFATQRRLEGIVGPWLWYCVGVSATLVQMPLRCFLEGSNQVGRMQRLSLVVSVAGHVAAWATMLAGGGLYTLAALAGVQALVGAVIFVRATWPFLRLVRQPSAPTMALWRREFWPQQWRIGVSWLAGLLQFHVFVPILFYFQGAKVAGQMGVTWQLYQAVNLICYSWVSAWSPQMGILGALGKYADLDALVSKTFRVTLATCALLSLGLLGALAALPHWLPQYGGRFADLGSIAILLATLVVLQRPTVEIAAVRFQKREPFYVPSVLTAAAVVAGTIILGRHYGIRGAVLGFAGVMGLVMTPWVHVVYRALMRKWTQQEAAAPLPPEPAALGSKAGE